MPERFKLVSKNVPAGDPVLNKHNATRKIKCSFSDWTGQPKLQWIVLN